MSRRWWAAGLVFTCSMLIPVGEASVGDRSMWYSSCTRKCRDNFDCPQEFSSFGWVQGNCFWCRYDCMWETVEQFEMSFGYVPQFHGKWPFAAIPLPFGLVIQEPASVVFSLLNLLTFFLMLRKIKKMDFLPRRSMWVFYAHVGLFTWVGSTVFHTMDCHYTELLDYNGAVAFIITALYVSMVFVYGDDPLYGRLEWYYTKVAPLFFIGFYLKYSYEMFKKLDYGMNMKCCITMSIITSIIYFHRLYKRKKYYGELNAADILLIRLIIWGAMATALELLDFVPVFWILDSHALFHLATAPIPIWWADYLQQTYQPLLEKSENLKIA